jgi:hypothetical protein
VLHRADARRGVAKFSEPAFRKPAMSSDSVVYFELAGTAKIMGTVLNRPMGARSFSHWCFIFELTMGMTIVSVPPM